MAKKRFFSKSLPWARNRAQLVLISVAEKEEDLRPNGPIGILPLRQSLWDGDMLWKKHCALKGSKTT